MLKQRILNSNVVDRSSTRTANHPVIVEQDEADSEGSESIMHQRFNIPMPESMSQKQPSQAADDDNFSGCQSSQESRHSRISMLQEKRAESTRNVLTGEIYKDYHKNDAKDLRASARSNNSRQSSYRQSVALQQI
jgi:hypothetical protein